MKSLKAFCAIGILSLFFSCAYQEDTAAFFIDNQLNENLIIQRATDGSTSSTSIHQDVALDLTTSESYDKYILRLRELDIVRFECNFSNYQGTIENGKLYIDDIFLGDFNASLDHVSIEDPQLLEQIGELFLEKTILDVSFVGESDTTHFLSVSIEVEMKGTFVY